MKRGDIAVSYVVIAVIAFLVLVLIALFVTETFPKITKRISDIGPGDEDVGKVKCEQACTIARQASSCDEYQKEFCDKYADDLKKVPCNTTVTCTPPASIGDCPCE